MKWTFYSHGFPPDLEARLTAARTKAILAFDDAKRTHSRADTHQLLIDVRIKPEVIERAHCLCEAAKRGLLPVGQVEHYVDEGLSFLAREVGPRESADLFVRDVVARIAASSEWREYLLTRLAVADQLAARDPASAIETVADNQERPSTESTDEDLVSLRAAATRLGVHVDTIRRMAQREEIRIVTVGRRTKRVARSEIKRLLGTGKYFPKR